MKTLGLVVAALMAAGTLMPAPAAWAHRGEDSIGWRVTWAVTREDDHERVRVRAVVTNGSSTQRFAGTCTLMIWNRTDAARHTFAVALRPGERVQERVTVVLDGTSDAQADMAHCHARSPSGGGRPQVIHHPVRPQ